MSDSPTSRTLRELRKRGVTAQVVERFNTYTKRRIDLFGVIDLVAITPEGILGIQACAGPSHSTRRAKIQDELRAAEWIKAGAHLEVWSWSKRGPANKRKLWTVRIERVQLADFPSANGWETRAVVGTQQPSLKQPTPNGGAR